MSGAAAAESPAVAARAGVRAGPQSEADAAAPSGHRTGADAPNLKPAQAAGVRLVALGGDSAAAMLKLVAVPPPRS